MKLAAFMFASLSLFSTWSLQAAVQEIPVDGTVQSFQEDFDPATYKYALYKGFWRWTGPMYYYESVKAHGDKYEGFRQGFIHEAGTRFISNRYLYDPQHEKTYRGTGEAIYRGMEYRIMGRDPNKNYRMVATQSLQITTPETRGSEHTVQNGYKTSIDVSITCKATSTVLAQGSWGSITLGTLSHESVAAAKRLTPSDCPTNEFIVKTFIGEAQEVDFEPLELVVLEETN